MAVAVGADPTANDADGVRITPGQPALMRIAEGARLAAILAEAEVETVTDTLSSISEGNETFPPIAGRWFNLTLRGSFVATAVIKRKFPGSEVWDTVSRDAAGTDAVYTAKASLSLFEPKAGTLYRVDCTARTSGSIEVEWNQ